MGLAKRWEEDAMRYAQNADYWRGRAEKAEATSTRAHGLVESQRMRNVLGYDICDDCGRRWPGHDQECFVGQLAAILRDDTLEYNP
jgi:hypothetical protein